MNRSTTFNRGHVALVAKASLVTLVAKASHVTLVAKASHVTLVAKASHVILRRSSLAFLLNHIFFYFW